MINEKKDAMYLARVFDLGGSIGIRKTNPIEKIGKINYTYRTRFELSSKNKLFIERIVKTFGGRMHIWKAGANGIRFVWRPTKDELMPILLKIYPFIHYKKEQVKCLMSFFNNCIMTYQHHVPNIPLSRGELELRENYYLEMKELNRNDRNCKH